MAAWQWSAGPEEWWAGWAGTAGIIPPPRGEEGFRSESARDPGGCAPGCPQRQEWWGELPEKSSGVLREGGCRSDSRGRRPFTARSTAARPVLMCQRGRSTRGSGYHEPAGRVSATTTRRRRLTLFIKTEFSASDGTYGYRRITAALWRRGVVVDRDTVRSIMREQGLVAAQPRRKVRTTVPAADLGSRPDLVKRDFTASQPGVKWVGDITLYQNLGGTRLSGDRPGLLHQESSRLCDGGQHAHRPDMRGDRYGGPQVPVHERRDDLPLRPR